MLNAPDLDNTTSLYDLRDFTLLLPPGINHPFKYWPFAKVVIGTDGKVINLCDLCLHFREAIFSKL